MRVPLPNPQAISGPHSAREEISDAVAEFRKYRDADLSKDVQEMIRSVAMNLDVSQKVIGKIQSESPTMHKKFIKFSAICAALYLLPLALNPLAGLLSKNYYIVLSPPGRHAVRLPLSSLTAWGLWIIIWLIAAEWFILEYYDWRAQYRDAYMADYLIRAVEIGLMYQKDVSIDRLRDFMAVSIQRAAIRYSKIYKKSEGTRFFKAQLRAQARRCRNDIMTLVPCLVTASSGEVQAINSDLTRLLIRTQTGYWYQTSDISKQGMPMSRISAIRISLSSFAGDRSIQAAFIALTATLASGIIAAFVTYLK